METGSAQGGILCAGMSVLYKFQLFRGGVLSRGIIDEIITFLLFCYTLNLVGYIAPLVVPFVVEYPIKALDYHKDINFNEPIEMLESKYKWKDIEHRLGQMTLHPTKIFNQIYELKQHNEKEQKQSRDQGAGIE